MPKTWIVAVATAVVCASLLAIDADAEHGMPGLATSGKTLPTNGRIHLHSYNGVAWIASQLFAGSPSVRATLVTGKRRVRLRVVDGFDDMEGAPRDRFAADAGYGEAVLVLAADKPLEPETAYDLVVDYTFDATSGPQKGTLSLGSWTSTTGPDEAKPVWATAPVVQLRPDPWSDDKTGLRPVVVASLSDTSETLEIIVDVASVRGGNPRRLLAVFDTDGGTSPRNTVDGETKRESCQVVHAFERSAEVGKRQRVVLTAVDAAGNRAPAPGGALKFAWPAGLGITVCLRR